MPTMYIMAFGAVVCHLCVCLLPLLFNIGKFFFVCHFRERWIIKFRTFTVGVLRMTFCAYFFNNLFFQFQIKSWIIYYLKKFYIYSLFIDAFWNFFRLLIICFIWRRFCFFYSFLLCIIFVHTSFWLLFQISFHFVFFILI